MDRWGFSEDCPVCGNPESYGHFTHCPVCGRTMCDWCVGHEHGCRNMFAEDEKDE
jgi:hypothetical protein